MDRMKRDQHIKGLYERELFLLHRLEKYLAMERKCLMRSDITTLSAVKREKEKTFKQIQDVQTERKNCAEMIADGKDSPLMQGLRVFESKLRVSRGKVRNQIKENMDFVQDMLLFFEGLISSILIGNNDSPVYTNIRKIRSGHSG